MRYLSFTHLSFLPSGVQTFYKIKTNNYYSFYLVFAVLNAQTAEVFKML